MKNLRAKRRLLEIKLLREDKNKYIEKTFTPEDLQYISSLPTYENKRKPSDHQLSARYKRKLRLGLQNKRYITND